MIKKLRGITRGNFFRNVVIVAAGTAGAQAITMLFAPMVTRIYGPEAFGILGAFVAMLGVLTPISALTYPIAIVLPKSDAEAIILAKLSAVLAMLIALMTTIIILLFGGRAAEVLNLAAVKDYMLLLPLAMLFSAFQQILTQWMIRKKEFKVTAKVAVIQALAINLSKVGVGWFYPMGAVLIFIASMGHALHTLMLWMNISSNVKFSKVAKINSGAARMLAYRYRDFPLYRTPQVTLNALSQSLPVLMLASFSGPAAAGFYTLGKTVMGLPSILIGKSVADVFYPRISEAARSGEDLFGLISKATLLMAAAGLIPFGTVVVLGPWLFGTVFGDEWTTAGDYARWLALWLYVGFLNRPSVAAIAAIGLQGFFLIYEIFSVVIRVAAIFIGFKVLHSDIAAVALFSLSGMVLNAMLIGFTLLKSLRVNISE